MLTTGLQISVALMFMPCTGTGGNTNVWQYNTRPTGTRVNTGFVVSRTMIFWVMVAVLPQSSVAFQVVSMV